jgi:hypothetical protein
MKQFLIVFILGLLCVAHAQEERKRVRFLPRPPLSERLNGKTEWQMSTGDTLKIASADGVTRLLRPRGVIIEIPEPEAVHQVVASRSVSCLLLCVMSDRPSGGSDYSRLVRVSRDAHGAWVAHTLFTQAVPPMNELHRWVSEIGAISDSGRMALLKVGEANQEAAPYRMKYSWQTWLLDTPKKVADGILVPDDFNK